MTLAKLRSYFSISLLPASCMTSRRSSRSGIENSESERRMLLNCSLVIVAKYFGSVRGIPLIYLKKKGNQNQNVALCEKKTYLISEQH